MSKAQKVTPVKVTQLQLDQIDQMDHASLKAAIKQVIRAKGNLSDDFHKNHNSHSNAADRVSLGQRAVNPLKNLKGKKTPGGGQ